MQSFDPFRAKMWRKSTKGSNRKCVKTGCGKPSRQNSNVNADVISLTLWQINFTFRETNKTVEDSIGRKRETRDLLHEIQILFYSMQFPYSGFILDSPKTLK